MRSNPTDIGFTLEEIGNTYAGAGDRFIVSLVVGYTEDDLRAGDHELTPESAARCALNLTRDESAGDTHWYVFDRKTAKMALLEQRQFDLGYEGFRAGIAQALESLLGERE